MRLQYIFIKKFTPAIELVLAYIVEYFLYVHVHVLYDKIIHSKPSGFGVLILNYIFYYYN